MELVNLKAAVQLRMDNDAKKLNHFQPVKAAEADFIRGF